VENTLSFLGQSFFSSFRLEIAASAVKFFGAGENVAFPLEMNFDCESDLTKRGHTKKNRFIFIFLGFLVAPSARFQSVPLIAVNLEERNSSPLMDDDSQHKKSRVRVLLSLFIPDFFGCCCCCCSLGRFYQTERKEKSATRLLLSKKGAVCVKAHGLNRAD
jgi:hypothetical protein